MGVVEEYITLTAEAQAKYGEKTVVLYQVGTFFEIYGLVDKDDNISGSQIEDICKGIGLKHSIKSNQRVGRMRVAMAGFNVTQREKRIKEITDYGYVCDIYVQDTQAKNTTRSHDETVSPGTFFDVESTSLSNNIVCVWIERVKASRHHPDLVVMGVASVDNLTGHSTVVSFNREYIRSPSTYDDLERQLAILNPCECVFVTNMQLEEVQEVAVAVGLSGVKIIIVTDDNAGKLGDNARNAEKQVYQDAALSTFFPHVLPEAIGNDIRQHAYGMQAFVMLLDYVHQQNSNLVSCLQYPSFDGSSSTLLLANHSLKQLNIISDERHSGKCSSVSALLDNCITPMGSRRFRHNITAPITDAAKLEDIYEITQQCIDSDIWNKIRVCLKPVRDTEKALRRIVLSKTNPDDLVSIARSFETIKSALSLVESERFLSRCIQENNLGCSQECQDVIGMIKDTFIEEVAEKIDDISPGRLGVLAPKDACFVRPGVCPEIDTLLMKSSQSNRRLQLISAYLSSLVSTKERSSRHSNAMVKVHETPKSDPCLLTTQRRGALLMSGIKDVIKSGGQVKLGEEDDPDCFFLDAGSLSTVRHGNSKNDVMVVSTQITALANDVQASRDQLIEKLGTFFVSFVESLANKSKDIEKISRFASWVDNVQNRCYSAVKYNYARPKVISGEKSSFNALALRHPLIEKLQLRESYVPNDVELGSGNNGMLLYGVNAVGKTSLIRAAGIAVVMAQAGMFVPCSSFTFTPYKKLFTRILGNDNLFKGLSTFAVEMSELRTILNQADAHSLVLGDELCSGTESNSATSIFSSGVEWLHNLESTFLFATHFHEVIAFEEIKNLDKLSICHMEVRYDVSKKLLVYDRKLKEGPGDSMYGLEVCKALSLPDKFLERAHEIRVRYDQQSAGVLSKKKTRYNAKKLKGNCEICGDVGIEVHHRNPQQNADKNGFIGGMHKNNTANLMNLCEGCHDKIHVDGGTLPTKVVKTSNGYKVEANGEIL